jgi:hypothetical protein
MKQVT